MGILFSARWMQIKNIHDLSVYIYTYYIHSIRTYIQCSISIHINILTLLFCISFPDSIKHPKYLARNPLLARGKQYQKNRLSSYESAKVSSLLAIHQHFSKDKDLHIYRMFLPFVHICSPFFYFSLHVTALLEKGHYVPLHEPKQNPQIQGIKI